MMLRFTMCFPLDRVNYKIVLLATSGTDTLFHAFGVLLFACAAAGGVALVEHLHGLCVP